MPLGFQSYLPSNHDAWHPVTTIETHLKAFNEAGEVKIAIANNLFEEMDLKLNGPRGLIVKDGIIYVASEYANRVAGYKYTITESVE